MTDAETELRRCLETFADLRALWLSDPALRDRVADLIVRAKARLNPREAS